MIDFTMFHSGRAGEPANAYYRNAVTIRNADDLRNVCRFDHVCAEFGNDFHRCKEDFIRCFAVAGDCDNDDTEDPAAWLDPSTVAERAPGVMFYYCASRNNGKTKHPGEKGEKGPRPRYHYYFVLKNPIADHDEARKVYNLLLVLFPEFDANGCKPAQFFFGHNDPVTGMVNGKIDLVEFFAAHPEITIPKTAAAADPEEEPQRVQRAANQDDFISMNAPDMLAVISADDYGTWVEIGMALKAAGEDISLWDSWSKSSSKYPGYPAIVKKWNSFKDTGKTGPGTLVYHAKLNGWTIDPAKLTGECKKNYEEAQRIRKERAERHRQNVTAALATVGLDDIEYSESITVKYQFDGNILQIMDTETGEIIYTAPDATAQVVQGMTVRQAVEIKPAALDPAAPWEKIVKGDALPVFPLERFPGWIKDYIENFSENTGISKDFCAACVLGAVSSVVCGKLDIHFNTTHYEPAQLYTVFVGRSGMMKSTAIKQFTGPARTWLYEQNQSVRKYNQGITDEISKLNDNYYKAQKKGRDETVLVELKAQIDRKKEEQKVEYPVPFSDVTPESLVRALITTNGTATIATAEGNIINVLTGRSYTQRGAAPNLDIFLNGHDGEPYHNNRVTTGEVDLPRVDISILMAIQPALLETLCRSQDANGRGLVQRFLIFAPEESDEIIDHTKPDTTDRRYSLRWNDHIRKIAERFMKPDAKPYIMELDLLADKIIRECWNYEGELARERGTDEEGIAGWISKLHGTALRLAAIFALLENPDATYITDADAEKAVTLLKEYFIPHYIGSFETMINMSNEQKAVATWIVRHAQRTGNRDNFTEHEAYVDLRQRSAFTGKAGQTNFRAALEDLQTKNYIRPLPIEKTASGRGRPSKSWQINPEIYTIKIPK